MYLNIKAISVSKNQYRWFELIMLFGCVPLVLYQFRHTLEVALLPLLFFASVLCISILLKDHTFKRFRLWNKQGIRTWIGSVFALFSGLIFVTTLFFYLYQPDYLFYMPVTQTSTWLIILVVYPLFSALPQEIIFRTFMFHRYKTILPNKDHRIWLSSLAFGYAHIVYDNWLAVILSCFAGYVFCKTYAQSRSTILVTIEHSLWGLWIFTLGLGVYFDSAYIQ